MNNSFYYPEELHELGLKWVGEDVLISRKCSIYSPEKITIGDNVRIDDFCILSGNITLGSHIHISAYVGLYGANGIIIEDYSGISPKSLVFSAMDDFSGDYLIGPIHEKYKTNVTGGEVRIERYCQIGATCILFPNIIIKEGTVVGAMSILKQDTLPWGIYAGVPAKRIKERSKSLLRFTS